MNETICCHTPKRFQRNAVALTVVLATVILPSDERLSADSRFTERQKLTASDGAAGDNFGFVGLAISGNTMVIGANLDDVGANVDQGSVYIFTRQGGFWSEQQKLTASDGAAGDAFGRYVALHGSTLIVGAPGDDIGSNLNQGSAYVFRRWGGAWIEDQKLTASDGAATDQFGLNMDFDGSTLVVSTRFDDVGVNVDQGSAYVFIREEGVWTEQQHLIASDGAAGDMFGFSVGIDGPTIVLGATMDDVGANLNQGSAYVFRWHGGVWNEQQKLTASDGAAGDQFGTITGSVSSTTIMVGALVDDVGANANQGSTYVFGRQAGVWSEHQKLTASDGAADDQFGLANFEGSTAVIGARFDDIDANANQGSAYVFTRENGLWLEQQKLIASDGAAGDQFGFFVKISGNTVALTAPGDDIGANLNQGSVYVFGPEVGDDGDSNDNDN